MASYDAKMGEGDSLPARRAVAKVNGTPFDLTGCTVKLKRAMQYSTDFVLRDVDIDPDQVTNPGAFDFTWFDPDEAEPGVWEFRVKATDGNGDKISFDGDRLLLVLVTRDPGTQTG